MHACLPINLPILSNKNCYFFCFIGRVGSPHFASPEVAECRPYGKPVDVWAAGVLLHVLLSGSLPYRGTGERLRRTVCNGRVNVSSSGL